MPAVFVVGHGSRRADSNVECVTLCERFAALSGRATGLGYIELAQPDLTAGFDAIAVQGDDVTVLPLMLFAAGHVKHDVPAAVEAARSRHPAVRFRIAQPLGIHPNVIGIARRRAASALAADRAPQDQTVVLFVGRGSSDPDANGDLYKTARLFGEGRAYALVQPAFIGATEPSVPAALRIVERLAPRYLLVVPYLLFAGLLVQQLRQTCEDFARAHPDMHVAVAEHLGPDPALAELIGIRVAAAEAEGVRLPEDGAQQPPMTPRQSNDTAGTTVGGPLPERSEGEETFR